MPTSRRAVLLLTLALAGAACSSSDDGSGSSATTQAPVPVTRPGSSTECLPRASTVARESAEAPDKSIIVDTAVDSYGCTDVVEFDFESAGDGELPPRYEAQYEDGPFFGEGEGEDREELEIGGDAFLVIRFDDTYTVDVREEGFPEAYTGLTIIQPGRLNWLMEVRKLPDTESTVTWVIGVFEERPFSIDSSAAPPTVVVTIG